MLDPKSSGWSEPASGVGSPSELGSLWPGFCVRERTRILAERLAILGGMERQSSGRRVRVVWLILGGDLSCWVDVYYRAKKYFFLGRRRAYAEGWNRNQLALASAECCA